MVVLENDAPADRAATAVREIAYEVLLEHGPVVECHVLTEREYEWSLAAVEPVVRRVTSEGVAYGW